jgi:hypothetical protein
LIWINTDIGRRPIIAAERGEIRHARREIDHRRCVNTDA